MKSNFTQETNFVLTEEFAAQHAPAGETIQKVVALWLAKEIQKAMD